MSDIDAKQIVLQINNLWLGEKCIYPGPQPISIERKHISVLQSHKYYVGHKNDGERYAVCCIYHENKPRCFLLNRKLEVKPIALKLSRKLYDGTILDCELVNNTLFIFDVPLFSGISLKSKPFSERLDFAHAFIKGCKLNENDVFRFKVKDFVLRENFKTLKKCENSDGYIFVPEDKHVQTSTHNFYFKWKPLIKNTIDFALNTNCQVFLQNAGKLCKAPNVTVNYQNNEEKTIIVECQYEKGNTWKGLHLRHDKLVPNSLFTYKRTLVNIEENIQISELVS